MSEEEISCEQRKPISFMAAIEKRYIESQLIPKEVLELPQNVGKQRTIELVGFEKTFERLLEVNVSQMDIGFSGDIQSLRQVLSQTKTLVMARNLLTNWSEVAKIVRNLQSLTDLVLSYNKLHIPSSDQLDYQSFQSIKTLIIDNLDYNWSDILFCSQMWPNIQRLDVWGNKITELSTPDPKLFQHLQYLSLCHNDIKDWTQICKLGSLPKLNTLDVSNCGLKEIRFVDSDVNQKTNLFRELESLLISGNQLSKWEDIAELNKLEKLNSLLIKNNPVFDNEKYDTNFNLIISRIESLKLLNREKITERMRRDAEISYLRKVFGNYESIRADEQLLKDFTQSNPRFETILNKYGTPFGTNVSKEELNRKKFLNIKIQSPFDNDSKIEKKIPASISIINFKTIIRKLFDIDYDHDIQLVWTSKDNFECLLDKESQNLNFYSIENGDTIVVNLD